MGLLLSALATSKSKKYIGELNENMKNDYNRTKERQRRWYLYCITHIEERNMRTFYSASVYGLIINVRKKRRI
mgnify:CR=1 FL=1